MKTFAKWCLCVVAIITISMSVAIQVNAELQANHHYYIQHKYSNKFICTGFTENSVESVIHLWGPIPDGHADRYKFKLVPSGDGDYYYLKHKYSDKFMCTGFTENSVKSVLHLWGPIPDGHEDRYKFKLIPTGDGYYYLLHKYSNKYVCTGFTENSVESVLHLWGPIPDGHADRYKFSFVPAE